MNIKSAYLAIKIKGMNHWLWFKRSNSARKDGKFTGVDGWGDGGAPTDITVDEDLIEGEIASSELQYE